MPTDLMSGLAGKTVLVTGGARGIGVGIVRVLAAHGAAVVFTYRSSEDAARALVAELGHERVLGIRADQAEAREVLRMWDEARTWRGHIDVIVSNAAVRPYVTVDDGFERWDEAWRWALDANLIATAHLCRLGILHFREHGGGIIIGVTGRIAVRGDAPEALPDGAAKGGIASLLRGISRGFAQDGIVTFLVSPGVINSPAAEEHLERYGAEEWLREIPMGRFGDPEDVGNVVAFLASGAADYSTGTSISVHGGSFVY
jgi:3-oxoacyl-[acyl-carrier protein] reductase